MNAVPIGRPRSAFPVGRRIRRPGEAIEGRCNVVKPGRLHVIIQQMQPVPQPVFGHHALAAGGKPVAGQVVPDAPPAPGIESGDYDMPVGPKDEPIRNAARVNANENGRDMLLLLTLSC